MNVFCTVIFITVWILYVYQTYIVFFCCSIRKLTWINNVFTCEETIWYSHDEPLIFSSLFGSTHFRLPIFPPCELRFPPYHTTLPQILPPLPSFACQDSPATVPSGLRQIKAPVPPGGACRSASSQRRLTFWEDGRDLLQLGRKEWHSVNLPIHTAPTHVCLSVKQAVTWPSTGPQSSEKKKKREKERQDDLWSVVSLPLSHCPQLDWCTGHCVRLGDHRGPCWCGDLIDRLTECPGLVTTHQRVDCQQTLCLKPLVNQHWTLYYWTTWFNTVHSCFLLFFLITLMCS